MKFRRTCELPKELHLVWMIGGLIAATGIGVWIGLRLLEYSGDTLEANAGILAACMGIAIWFIAAWILEGSSHREDSRQAAVVFGTIISILMAMMGSAATQESSSPFLSDWNYIAVWSIVLIASFVFGWLGHWCKRCIRIENPGVA